MFRISRTTDYGIVLLAHLAREPASDLPRDPAREGGLAPGDAPAQSARELAEEVDLPAPMVSKTLKRLARAGLLESVRGAKGGYRLLRRPENLSVAEMVAVLEGPVAITDCSIDRSGCEHAGHCAVRDPWNVINHAVNETLREMTLADLIDPRFARQTDTLQILGAGIPLAAGSGATATHRTGETDV